jgi:TP901-1 family phage major tail protein
MAAQKGAALLVKLGNGASPEVFTTIAGLRSTSMTANDEPVDITNKDSTNTRTLLPQGGVRSFTISGSGVFLDAAGDDTLRQKLGAATFANFQLIVPDFGTFTGPFMVASLEYAGEYNGEVTYSLTLESAGTVTFVSV